MPGTGPQPCHGLRRTWRCGKGQGAEQRVCPGCAAKKEQEECSFLTQKKIKKTGLVLGTPREKDENQIATEVGGAGN